MPAINISIQRIDSSLNPNALLPKTVASIVYRNSGVSVEDELNNKLPEPMSSIPSTLTEGKIISVNGVIYVGNTSNVPVKVNYTHPTTDGNKHLPAGGTAGQMLVNSASGTGTWKDIPTASTSKAGIVQLNSTTNSTSNTQAATPSAVKAAYDLANHTHPYINTNQIGVAGGVAPLGSDKKIEAQYLPSYVDDVLEGTVSSDLSSFTLTGESTACTPETGKIYSDVSTNKTYRWGGSKYIRMDDGIALGETSSTAYRGDRGKIAYDHSQSDHARVDATLVEASSTNGNVKINGSETKVYTHPTTAGNKHLPTGGTVGQYLKNSASGTGTWANIATSVDANTTDPVAGKVLHTVQTNLQSQIDSKASSDHNHDSRYYTETETDALLKNKSDTTHTHAEATQDSAGFMSADDKVKLDGIAFGANQIAIDSALSTSSTNPVQNKIITAELNTKATTAAVNAKQDTITGAATTVTDSNLTASRALISDANGKIGVSAVTSTELSYLDGVTSAIQTQLNAKAALASPTFTGTPKAPTATAGTNTTQIATTEFVTTAVNNLLGAQDALVFKGALAAGATLPAADAGHVYRVTSDGTISGLTVHEGDMLTCFTDGSSAGASANWLVTHTNHDGQVMGPTSAVNNRVALFDGTTGKLIKDSGFTIGTSVPSGAKFTDTVYTHPTYTAQASGLYKITIDGTGHVSATAAVQKSDITDLGIPAQDTVYTHPTTAGNKHIPTGGSANQYLKYSASGTAAWATPDSAPTNGSANLITSSAVYAALKSLSVESIIEQNGSLPTYFWVGTKAEYDAMSQHYTVTANDTIYVVTDEDDSTSWIEGIKFNGSTATVVNGVAELNALTGIVYNGATVTPANGVASINGITGITYNGTTLTKSGAGVVTINEALKAVKLNGTQLSISGQVSNINAATKVVLNGDTYTVDSSGSIALSNVSRTYYGTTDPDVSIGSDGDIYIKYSDA